MILSCSIKYVLLVKCEKNCNPLITNCYRMSKWCIVKSCVVLKTKNTYFLLSYKTKSFFLFRALFGVQNDLDKKKYICFLQKTILSIFFVRNLPYLSISECGFRISEYRVPISECGFRNIGFKFRKVDFGFRIVSNRTETIRNPKSTFRNRHDLRQKYAIQWVFKELLSFLIIFIF
jgi:hypothetical protein